MIYLAVLCALEMVGTFLCVKVLIDERGRAEAAWTAERATLLQRIQAPQAAVIQHANETTEFSAPPAVNEFIDEDYWESQDELADRLMKQEINGG